MIRMKEWFGWKKEESREDRLSRLASELRSMTDEDRRRFIRRVWPEGHFAVNPPRGVPKKRKGMLDDYAKEIITEVEKEESHAE
jgi:hypothetical protein